MRELFDLGAAVEGAAVSTGDAVARILNWAADEIDAQAAAHEIDEPQILDLTDHIRCFADQPNRRSLTPWPSEVPRPDPERS